MSSVHYKFKAILEYKTLTFAGLHIGVDELKKAICDKENIRTESFDLLLTNAHTKREYKAGELVPRNSSVIVQRVPRDNAQKLPKVQDTSTSGIVQRHSGQQAQSSSYINPDDFAKMSEEQRIAHIKQVSTEKYSAANYQRRTTGIMTGLPPPTYVCNRCGQPGHWFKMCPLLTTKRTTGIPMEELMETSRDDPLAMLHPSGKYVKPIMHYQARMQRKHEPFPGQTDETGAGGSPYATGEHEVFVPEQYKCNLCGGLLREAVLAACCGHSFCAECYQQQLLEHPTEQCPGPECKNQISADSLIPNKSLRAAIQKYLNEVYTGSNSPSQYEQQQQSQKVTGANKPSVLTDTQSLLHKLMPDLAYAQAKRELATTTTIATSSNGAMNTSLHIQSSMTATTSTNDASRSPLPSQQQQQTTHTTTDEQNLTAPTASSTTTNGMVSSHLSKYTTPTSSTQFVALAPSSTAAQSLTIGGAQQQQPTTAAEATKPPPSLLPALFDPHRPPPPIPLGIAASLAAVGTPPPTITAPAPTASSMSVPPPLLHNNATSASANFVPATVTTTPLSAQELSSVWENFLKRKDDEKTKREEKAAAAKLSAAAATAAATVVVPPPAVHVDDVSAESNWKKRKGKDTKKEDLSSVWEILLKRMDKDKEHAAAKSAAAATVNAHNQAREPTVQAMETVSKQSSPAPETPATVTVVQSVPSAPTAIKTTEDNDSEKVQRAKHEREERKRRHDYDANGEHHRHHHRKSSKSEKNSSSKKKKNKKHHHKKEAEKQEPNEEETVKEKRKKKKRERKAEEGEEKTLRERKKKSKKHHHHHHKKVDKESKLEQAEAADGAKEKEKKKKSKKRKMEVEKEENLLETVEQEA